MKIKECNDPGTQLCGTFGILLICLNSSIIFPILERRETCIMLLQWSPDSSSKLGTILHVFRNIPNTKDIFISAHKGTDTIRFISSGTLINRPSA